MGMLMQVYGPTGVGKSLLADIIASGLPEVTMYKMKPSDVLDQYIGRIFYGNV